MTQTVLEPYIPATRQELVETLCRSEHLSDKERTQFRQFCEILNAYAHFAGQKDLELMKFAFSDFDPNAEKRPGQTHDQASREDTARVFIDAFDRTLKRANYQALPRTQIHEAMNKASIIPVQTSVDFSEFEHYAFYYRTSNKIRVTVKRWFRRQEIEIDNYDRLAVLLQVKDKLETSGSEQSNPELLPGKMYINLYKNIPHHDLELLFPNLKIGMTLRDRLILAVPAVGAAVPLLIKILPSVGLLVGAVALFVFGLELGGRFAVGQGEDTAVYALLTALLSIVIAFGGFAARQYTKYKSLRLEFLKKVTDVLFFKSLDIGSGVLNALVDAAEEEECKEMILVFYLLLVNQGPMDDNAVDDAAEQWLMQHFGAAVDFDVTKALASLAAIRGRDSGSDTSIVTRGDDGGYVAVTIEQAKKRINRIWDNAFRY